MTEELQGVPEAESGGSKLTMIAVAVVVVVIVIVVMALLADQAEPLPFEYEGF